MARQKIKVRKPEPAEPDTSGGMLVIRGPKNIPQPTTKEIEGMRKRAFARKYPHTSA